MSNITAIHTAFDRFADTTSAARTKLLDALRAAGVTTVEEARPHVLTWAAKRYACPLVDGQRKASGQQVLDRTHRNYEAARKAAQTLQRVLSEGTPKVERAVQQVVVTRAERAAAMAFLSTFEGATLAEQIRAAKRVLAALA